MGMKPGSLRIKRIVQRKGVNGAHWEEQDERAPLFFRGSSPEVLGCEGLQRACLLVFLDPLPKTASHRMGSSEEGTSGRPKLRKERILQHRNWQAQYHSRGLACQSHLPKPVPLPATLHHCNRFLAGHKVAQPDYTSQPPLHIWVARWLNALQWQMIQWCGPLSGLSLES